MLQEQWKWIDKTEVIEQKIKEFPCVYIEGAAASGKSRVIEQMTLNHPEVVSALFLLKNGEIPKKSGKNCWYIVEGLHEATEEQIEAIYELIQKLTGEDRLFISGKGELPDRLLICYWKRQLDIIPQSALMFTEEEVFDLAKAEKCPLKAKTIYELTGGWPGCTEVLIRLTKEAQQLVPAKQLVDYLKDNYLIRNFVQKELIESALPEERHILYFATVCPWISTELCETFLPIKEVKKHLESMERQGLLKRIDENKLELAATLTWAIAVHQKIDWEALILWYAEKSDYKAMWECMKKSESQELIKRYVIAYYDKWSLTIIKEMQQLVFEETDVRASYIKGVQAYLQGEKILHRAIIGELLQKDTMPAKEICWNLMWLSEEYSLLDCMQQLKDNASKDQPFHLYQALQGNFTYLCGVRDISGLFSCSKKQAAQYEQLWRNCVAQSDQMFYDFAKIDHAIETAQADTIQELLESYIRKEIYSTQFLYLLIKMGLGNERFLPEELQYRYIAPFRSNLRVQIMLRIQDFYRGKSDGLAVWLRYTQDDNQEYVDNTNIWYMMYRAKGYVLLKQYDTARKLCDKMLGYLEGKRMFRVQAEVLFLRALICQEKQEKNQALKYLLKMMVMCNRYRYVTFFSYYGNSGVTLLQEYLEWQEQIEPGKWIRKKKYQYANILRMKETDYVSYLIQTLQKKAKRIPGEEKEKEQLTMTETIILQNIKKGMSNEEIAEELHVQVSTVKTHIYSIYKKLGVKSRTQAINKGSQIGIL